MKLEINLGQWLSFAQNNWFKLSLAILGFYLFFIKQLSFQILVHTPEKTEQQQVKQRSIEKITENQTTIASAKNKLEKLEIPFLSSKPKKSRNILSELNTVNETTKHEYLERFAKVARAEQDKYQFPASVILAMGMMQSTAGTRDIATQTNNHFGLDCDSNWRSACKSFHGKSYRKYDSAWASFRDFSQYLESNFSNLKGGNYLNFANAFQNEQFGGDQQIGEHLVQIIEGYRLQELDH